MKKLALFIGIFICCFWNISAFSSEYIQLFDVHIQVNTDASLTVTERITVNPEGQQIKRGIYRDLPTSKGEYYEVIAVQRDGLSEQYRDFSNGGYKRIQIGNPNKMLPRGVLTTYLIQYKAYNTGLGRYAGYDEVYWNATGVWGYPIHQTIVRVALPAGTKFIQQASYRGKAGQKFSATYDGNNQFSTGLLHPGEQLTIGLGFTGGIIADPNKRQFANKDTQKILVSLALFFGMTFLYYFFIWFLFGRDIYRRAAMVEYEAPDDLTPAQCHVWKHCGLVDPKQLCLIHWITLAKDKFIDIQKGYKRIDVRRTEKEPQTLDEEFYDREVYYPIELDGTYDARIEGYVESYYHKEYDTYTADCKTNQTWAIIGVAFMIGVLWLLPVRTELKFISSILTAIIGLVCCYSRNRAQLASFFIPMIFFGYFFCSDVIFVSHMGIGYLIFPIGIIATVITMSLVFKKLLHQPTRAGAQKLAQMQGLEMFLKAVDIQTPADFTSQNAEDLYPYAVALDLGKEWNRKFKHLLSESVLKKEIYQTSFRNSMLSRISNSATKPSRSGRGGSSGGGSSGGGGGGGGGGGW